MASRSADDFLSQWVVAAGLALYPLYQAMKDKILASLMVSHIDESPVDLFDSPKMSSGYMWVLVGGVEAEILPIPLVSIFSKSKACPCGRDIRYMRRRHPLR